MATQVEKVVKKAYSMLDFIGQGIEFKNWQVMLQLYRTLGRIWNIVFNYGCHATRRMWRLWREYRKDLPGCCLVWRALAIGEVGETWFVLTGTTEVEG